MMTKNDDHPRSDHPANSGPGDHAAEIPTPPTSARTTDDGVTRTAPQTCPICAATLDAAGPFDSAAITPAPGDWTVCAYCLQWLVYIDGGGLRPVTGAEWLALTLNERTGLTAQRDRVRRAWARKL
jgi:hypothetical protein